MIIIKYIHVSLKNSNKNNNKRNNITLFPKVTHLTCQSSMRASNQRKQYTHKVTNPYVHVNTLT